ncbi:hypothetical protein GGI43DRAFT_273204 [Trichoderma evansii]
MTSRIGRHNVVIAVLPNGEYGISSAAGVAKDMLHSFPNIIGIGGGAPSEKHGIRLGDIVVGISSNGEGAVVQYDFGKSIQGEKFKETGFLNQAPTLLRTAVNNLRAEHELEGNKIQKAIDSVLAKKPTLRRNYKRPDASSDRLYQSLVIHSAEGEADCSTGCGNNPSSLVKRCERDENGHSPEIHYGLIASANTLMKDALVRDDLIERKDILCFEMEAAGLMNHFPCLVIRGICGYSDSHKNKAWQRYAAMTAAAYTKETLKYIAPTRIDAERKISEALSGLHEVTEEHRDIAKEQLQIQKDLVATRLSEKEKECHQLFRLTSDSEDATYEWYKDRIEERVENTCLWFLKHENFQKWINQESGPLLVTADPGCGKSVLAKYLVDYELPRLAAICYFFFKDQDQNTFRQALCALLHQIFSQKPALIKHAMPQFDKDGQRLSESTASLWKILRNVTEDPETGPVIIVVDALNECAESEFADLIRNVKSQFSDGHSSGQLKYLLTCRPYEQITSQFHTLLNTFPDIRIPGEDDSEAISHEVNYVITHRINQLSAQKNFTSKIKSYSTARLQSISHRTYLWVYLIFKHLEEKVFKKTQKGIETTIATLPSSINEVYERILNKSKEPSIVQKVLSILLAASRPLTLSEMNIAINLAKTSQAIYDLVLEDADIFKSRIRSLCGLFISVYNNKIYFLHQTARDFLLAKSSSPAIIPLSLSWQHSISSRHAHTTLAELCMIYLDLFNSTDRFQKDIKEMRLNNSQYLDFLDYSAENWIAHFHAADLADNDAISPFALRICNPDSKSYLLWSQIIPRYRHDSPPEDATQLILASYYGLTAVAKLCLEKGCNIEARSGIYTPLQWATFRSHEGVVKLLLERGANIDVKNNNSETPLLQAASEGHEGIVRLLLDKGANIEIKENQYHTTPLWRAALRGHKGIVRLLLKKGADIEVKDNKCQTTPLCRAVLMGHEGIVKLLLKKGADIEAKDNLYQKTPLWQATLLDHEGIVKLLLKKGANTEVKDNEYQITTLWQAASEGHKRIIMLLRNVEANTKVKKNEGQSMLLLWTASRGYKDIVKLLLNKGADIEAKDNEGMTPSMAGGI